MFDLIKLTHVGDGKPIYISCGHIVAVHDKFATGQNGDTLVQTDASDTTYFLVKESVETVVNMIRLRLDE